MCAGGYAEAKKLEKAVKAEKAERAEKAAPPSTPPPQPPQAPRKLNNRETRELEALPGKMETLEAEIAEIESALADPSIYAKDNARAVALTARLPVARAELDAAETHKPNPKDASLSSTITTVRIPPSACSMDKLQARVLLRTFAVMV